MIISLKVCRIFLFITPYIIGLHPLLSMASHVVVAKYSSGHVFLHLSNSRQVIPIKCGAQQNMNVPITMRRVFAALVSLLNFSFASRSLAFSFAVGEAATPGEPFSTAKATGTATIVCKVSSRSSPTRGAIFLDWTLAARSM